MTDPINLSIAAIFLLAGMVKGVIGLGLPTVSLALLSLLFDLPTAIALMLAPSFVTNLWQALAGAHTAAVIRRGWPFLLMATLTVALGAQALQRVDSAWLAALLGLLLTIYAASALAGLRANISPRHRRWAGPLLGAVNGLLSGMTGSFVVPGVIYLQAIGLAREAMIQAMGMLFSLSTLALAIALGWRQLLDAELATTSVLALIPAFVGMLAGQGLRKTIPEASFRRLFHGALLALGVYISARALLG